jgi:hypothetical protein
MFVRPGILGYQLFVLVFRNLKFELHIFVLTFSYIYSYSIQSLTEQNDWFSLSFNTVVF